MSVDSLRKLREEQYNARVASGEQKASTKNTTYEPNYNKLTKKQTLAARNIPTTTPTYKAPTQGNYKALTAAEMPTAEQTQQRFNTIQQLKRPTSTFEDAINQYKASKQSSPIGGLYSNMNQLNAKQSSVKTTPFSSVHDPLKNSIALDALNNYKNTIQIGDKTYEVSNNAINSGTIKSGTAGDEKLKEEYLKQYPQFAPENYSYYQNQQLNTERLKNKIATESKPLQYMGWLANNLARPLDVPQYIGNTGADLKNTKPTFSEAAKLNQQGATEGMGVVGKTLSNVGVGLAEIGLKSTNQVTGNPASLVALSGLEGYAQGAQDAKDSGFTRKEMYVDATVTGALDAASMAILQGTGKVLDKALPMNMNTVTTDLAAGKAPLLGTFAKRVGASALVQGNAGYFNAGTQSAMNRFFGGNNSQFNQLVSLYKENGVDNDKAKQMAFAEIAKYIMQDEAMGAAQGVTMGAIYEGIGSYNKGRNAIETYNNAVDYVRKSYEAYQAQNSSANGADTANQSFSPLLLTGGSGSTSADIVTADPNSMYSDAMEQAQGNSVALPTNESILNNPTAEVSDSNNQVVSFEQTADSEVATNIVDSETLGSTKQVTIPAITADKSSYESKDVYFNELAKKDEAYTDILTSPDFQEMTLSGELGEYVITKTSPETVTLKLIAGGGESSFDFAIADIGTGGMDDICATLPAGVTVTLKSSPQADISEVSTQPTNIPQEETTALQSESEVPQSIPEATQNIPSDMDASSPAAIAIKTQSETTPTYIAREGSDAIQAEIANQEQLVNLITHPDAVIFMLEDGTKVIHDNNQIIINRGENSKAYSLDKAGTGTAEDILTVLPEQGQATVLFDKQPIANSEQIHNELIDTVSNNIKSNENLITDIYGENGNKIYSQLRNTTTGSQIPAYIFNSAYNQAYLAGRHNVGNGSNPNVPPEFSMLPDDMAKQAFNAGKLDSIIARAAKPLPRTEGEGGLVYTDSDSSAYNEIIDELGKITGLKFKLKDEITEIHAGEKLSANGTQKLDNIQVALDSPNILATVSHETLHAMKIYAPKAYEDYIDLCVKIMMQANGDTYEELLAEYGDRYGTSNLDYINEEIGADAADFFNDEENIKKVCEANKSLAQKIINFLKDIVDKLKSFLKHSDAKPAEVVRASEFFDALTEKWFNGLNELAKSKDNYEVNTQIQAEVKQSINRDFASQIDAWDGVSKKTFTLGKTSEVLQGIGIEKANIVMHASKIKDMLTIHPEISREEIKKIPNILEDPTIVLTSLTRPDEAIVILGEEISQKNNKPLLVALNLVPLNNKGNRRNYKVVLSEYTRKNLQHILNDSGYLYVNPDKKRTSSWLQRYGVQFPFSLTQPDFGSKQTISYENNKIKTYPYYKLVKPESPTDIKMSIRQSSDIVNNLPTETKFQRKAPVERTKDLIAVHNLSQEQLIASLDMGGFPMPSVAIVKAKMGHNQYGDVSVLFDKESIDPQNNSLNKIYSGDAWTPVYPTIENKYSDKVLSELYREMPKLVEKTIPQYSSRLMLDFDESNLSNTMDGLTLEEGASRLANKPEIIAAYASEKGITILPVVKDANLWSYADGNFDNESVKKVAEYVGGDIEKLQSMTPEDKKALSLKFANEYFDRQLKDLKDKNYTGFLLRAYEKQKSEYKPSFEDGDHLVYSAEKYIHNGMEPDQEFDDYATQDRLREGTDHDEVTKWIKDKLKNVVVKQGIYKNGVDPYTRNGDRKSFEQTHMAVTLENLVKEMRSHDNGETIFGGMGIWGAAAQKYPDIASVKADKARLTKETEEKFKEIKTDITDRFVKYVSKLQPKYKYHDSNSFIEHDNIASDIIDAIRSSVTDRGLKSNLAEYFKDITDVDILELKNIVSDIASMPTGYFEAKPERAVYNNEIKGVIIPKDATELKARLESMGIETKTYTTDASRTKALNSFDDLKFSLKKPVEQTKDLIATHALNEDELKKAMKLGGLPMPSIAIGKSSNPANTNFGKISLVFNKSAVDPQADTRNKVYRGDAWTVTNDYGYDETSIDKVVESMIKGKAQNTMEQLFEDDFIHSDEYLLQVIGNREQLKSIKDIKENKGLLEADQADVPKRSIDDIATEVSTEHDVDYDEVRGAIYECAKDKLTTIQQYKDSLSETLGYKVDTALAKEVKGVVDYCYSKARGYFEAKPERAVGFEEVQAAIVPEGTSKKLIDQLQSYGIEVQTYSTPEQRLSEINNLEGLKFSLKPEQIQDTEQLQKENEEADNLIEALEKQFPEMIREEITEADARRVAKTFIKRYNSSYDSEVLTGLLMKVFKYISTNKALDAIKLSTITTETAKEILKQSSQLDMSMAESYPGLREYIRDSKVYIPESDRRGETFGYENYDDMVRHLGNLRNQKNRYYTFDDNGTSFDVFYQGLVEKYPGLFPDDLTNMSEQFDYVTSVVSQLKGTPITGLDGDLNENAFILGQEMLEDLYGLGGMKSAVAAAKKELKVEYDVKLKKAKQDVIELRQETAKKQKEAVANHNEKLAKIYKQKYQDLQADFASKVIYMQNEIKARQKRERLKKHNSQARTEVLKEARRLMKMKGGPDFEVAKKAVIGDIYLMSKGMRKSTIAGLQELQAQVRAQAAKDPDYAELEAKKYDNLFGNIYKKKIADMSAEELADLTESIVALIHSQETYNRAIRDQEGAKIAKLGRGVVENQNQVKGIDVIHKLSAARKTFILNSLSPVRAMRMMSGYKDDAVLTSLAEDLNNGQTKLKQFEMEAEKLFTPLYKNKKFIDGMNKLTIEISNSEGQKALITPGMRISLYLHSLNHQNLSHINTGGLTVPNATLYKRGDFSEAYNHGTRIKLKPSDIKKITEQMTPEEKEFAKVAQVFFNEVSKKAINETSMYLNGYEKAIVDNYMPIKTDEAFTKTDMSGLIQDGTIEGMGILKDRNSAASNPILLEDISKVLDKQIQSVGRYYGLAIPIRNMNKVLNYTSTGYAGSSIDSIRKAWGNPGQEYIKNMLSDINSGGRDQSVGLLEKLRSKYAGVTLAINAGVAIKQASSYPMALSVLDAPSLTKALKYFVMPTKKEWERIDSITPLFWERRQGMSTRELGDIAAKRSMVDDNTTVQKIKDAFNWIQKVDVKTTAVLFYATENYIKAHNPSVKVGSDEYNKLVADKYNQVLQRTQPSYNTMQRPEILRKTDWLSKTIGMFKTQSFQMGGELYDSYGEWVAKANEYKNNKTEENAKKVKDAGSHFSQTLTAVIMSQALFAGMSIMARAALHKMSVYRDKETGEITPESLAMQYADDFAGSMFGMMFGGSQAYDASKMIYTAITGKGNNKWYDVTAPGLDMLNSVVTSTGKMATLLGKLADGTMTKQQAISTVGNWAIDMSAFAGVPLNNIYDLINSADLWYQDIRDGKFGTFDSGKGLLGLKDTSISNTQMYNRMFDDIYTNKDSEAFTEAYNSMQSDAAVAQLKKRFSETPEVQEIAQMYADGNEEGASKAYQDFVDKMGSQYEPVILGGVNKAITALTDTGEDTETEFSPISSEDTIGTFSSEKQQSFVNAGGNALDYTIYSNNIKTFKADKDKDGKTISGSLKKKKIKYINALPISTEQKKILYGDTIKADDEDIPASWK